MSVLAPPAPARDSLGSPGRERAEKAFLEANPSFHETALVDELRGAGTRASTPAAMSTSITPAGACTRSHSFGTTCAF